MTHEEALNLLLSANCTKGFLGGVNTFEFELHCETAIVKAELVSTVGSIQYKVISVEFV